MILYSIALGALLTLLTWFYRYELKGPSGVLDWPVRVLRGLPLPWWSYTFYFVSLEERQFIVWENVALDLLAWSAFSFASLYLAMKIRNLMKKDDKNSEGWSVR